MSGRRTADEIAAEAVAVGQLEARLCECCQTWLQESGLPPEKAFRFYYSYALASSLRKLAAADIMAGSGSAMLTMEGFRAAYAERINAFNLIAGPVVHGNVLDDDELARKLMLECLPTDADKAS